MKSLINKKFKLERYPGKGGWTFVRIPQIASDKKTRFGLVKVKGSIDGYAIKKCHLMPMKGNTLFLPVKAEIRKALNKQAGDWVHIILYPDKDPLEIPSEFIICLEDEPAAFTFFNSLSESEKKYYVNWVYSAKREETKIARLAKTIERLSRKLKMYEKADDLL